jgi:hypothetical protein
MVVGGVAEIHEVLGCSFREWDSWTQEDGEVATKHCRSFKAGTDV